MLTTNLSVYPSLTHTHILLLSPSLSHAWTHTHTPHTHMHGHMHTHTHADTRVHTMMIKRSVLQGELIFFSDLCQFAILSVGLLTERRYMLPMAFPLLQKLWELQSTTANESGYLFFNIRLHKKYDAPYAPN